jgi:hypothetical protein
MATAKQAAANRRNAAKSTGPRTKSGKARSRRNALKHGLSAEQVVMLGEDPAAFEALRDDLYNHYQPETLRRGLPFSVEIPNPETHGAMREALEDEDLKEWSDLEALKGT